MSGRSGPHHYDSLHVAYRPAHQRDLHRRQLLGDGGPVCLGLGQREWIRVRAVVSGGPFVTVGLLVATLRHVGEFHGAVGVIWVEAYVFAVPAFFAAAVHQLMLPGRD